MQDIVLCRFRLVFPLWCQPSEHKITCVEHCQPQDEIYWPRENTIPHHIACECGSSEEISSKTKNGNSNQQQYGEPVQACMPETPDQQIDKSTENQNWCNIQR